MRRQIRCLALSVLSMLAALAFAPSSVRHSAAQERDPFLDMLAFVPDSPATREAGFGTLMPVYTNLRAVEAASGVEKPESAAGFDLTSAEGDRWVLAVQRITGAPSALFTRLLVLVEGMKATVGFDWFAIDQVLGFGQPPADAVLLAGSFDYDAVGAALAARDFEQREIEGVTVWHRFEDGQVSLQARDVTDPFGGELGKAARIALLPGYIANSAFWATMTAIIDTSHAKNPSLLAANDYGVLARAVTDPARYSGPLIQAMYFDVKSVGLSGDPAGALGRATPTPPPVDQGELPLYWMALLADRQAGAMQVHLVALAHPSKEAAQQAATVLHRRIASFDPLGLFERFSVTVDEPYVFTEASGWAAAVVAVRYPLPPAEPDPETGRPTHPGLVYRMWFSAILRRDFTPLALGTGQ